MISSSFKFSIVPSSILQYAGAFKLWVCATQLNGKRSLVKLIPRLSKHSIKGSTKVYSLKERYLDSKVMARFMSVEYHGGIVLYHIFTRRKKAAKQGRSRTI